MTVVVKNITRSKIAILPMALFLLALLLMKTSLLGEYSLQNPALASIGINVPAHKDQIIFSANPLETVHVWRRAKIQRSKIYYNPEMVTSMTSNEVEELLGTPDLVRFEGDARMLQYVSDNCIADFYYVDGNANEIAYFEIRDRHEAISLSSAPQNKKCLQKIFGAV